MKRILSALIVVAFLAVAGWAQTGNFAFGASGLVSSYPSSAIVDSGNPYAPSLAGGTYLTVNGDILPWKNFGFGGEVSWRASQNLYLGYQPYRPIFFSGNAVYAPRLGKHVGADLIAGVGLESIRFYNNYYTCNFAGCTNYDSSNHFMGVFGGGLKFYPRGGGFFIRPEVRLYLIRNNYEFNSNHAVRPGVSIGYTFGGESY